MTEYLEPQKHRPAFAHVGLWQESAFLNYLTNAPTVCMNTHMDSRRLIKMLEKEGWYKADQSGSHIQFRHPLKKGRVTVPHPKKDIPIGTLKSIEHQSEIKFK